ncbi:MAG: DUF2281 domain-containing protein [Caldilineaceae bacterium]
MINEVSVNLQQLYAQIQNLPPQSLSALAEYVEFLAFKARQNEVQTKATPPLQIVQLRGVLKGQDFSPSLLTEVRRELWKKFNIPSL